MSISEKAGVVRLDVYVQPRASRSEVVGEHGDAVKIRLAAPPVDGAANEELLRFLAKLVGTPAGNVSIAAGESSRRKTVALTGVSLDDVQSALARAARRAE